MHKQAETPGADKRRRLANTVTQQKSDGSQGFSFVDNRPDATVQKNIRKILFNYSVHQKQPIQKKEIINGLNNNLASGIGNPEGVLQAKKVGEIEVTFTPGYAQWEQDGESWHINWKLGDAGVYHVTKESSPKCHYFFTLDGYKITDAVAPKEFVGKSKKKVKGQGKVKTKNKFSVLPKNVQEFVKTNIAELIAGE